uniref:Uncharacterized protein n=1 Tax=Arion vulgaris TaxID=1028688 RepID=A0A0B6YJJ9_9EUPU
MEVPMIFILQCYKSTIDQHPSPLPLQTSVTSNKHQCQHHFHPYLKMKYFKPRESRKFILPTSDFVVVFFGLAVNDSGSHVA